MIEIVIYAVIFGWAVWCIASKRVKDGVVGRLGYSAVAIAAFAAVFSKNAFTIPVSNTVIIFAVALRGARHFTLKMLNYWQASRKQP